MKTYWERVFGSPMNQGNTNRESVTEVEASLREAEVVLENVLIEFDEAVDKLRNDYERLYLRRHCN